jgi:hypothetical protein
VRLLAAKPKQIGFAARRAAEDITKDSTQLAIAKSRMDFRLHIRNAYRMTAGQLGCKKRNALPLWNNAKRALFFSGIFETLTIFVISIPGICSQAVCFQVAILRILLETIRSQLEWDSQCAA